MKTLCFLFALSVMLDSSAAAKATANELLYMRANNGEAEAQEAMSRLMLTSRLKLFGRVADTRDEGTRFLYLAAIHGNARARQRMAAAARDGKLGVTRNADAANCWATSAPALQCVELTTFSRPKARPSCRQVTLRGNDVPVTGRDAIGMAKLCIANRTLTLFVPGGPPTNDTEILIDEFARNGIDYDVTGDVVMDDFEAFRGPFNELMEKQIVATHGADIFKTIMAAANAAIEKSRQRR
jgi:hypothetical protein